MTETPEEPTATPDSILDWAAHWPPPEPESPSFKRMTTRRTQPVEFRRAPTLRRFWLAEADTPGGLDDLRGEALQTQAEMFVRQVVGRDETGMTWRLSQMEAEMGLPDGGATGLSDDQRRDRIIARLRSWRIPTAFTIRSVAQSYAGNDVQVVMDYEAHSLTIRFTGTKLPENVADLQAEIIRLIPARIGSVYWVVTFLTWGDAQEVGVNWCQLEDAGWTWEQFENASREELPIDVICEP